MNILESLKKLRPRSTNAQIGAFAISGVVNTSIDFLILNILVFFVMLPLIPANLISTSIALGSSFTLNNKLVFGHTKTPEKSKIALFLAITLFGLYVIQSGIIFLLSSDSSPFGDVIAKIAQSLGIANISNFLETNLAKILATAVTSIWNFVLYKRYVFNG